MKNERGLWQTLLCCFGKSRTRPNSSSFAPSNSIRGVNAKPERSFTPPLLSPDPTQSSYLLPAIRHQDMHKKCMVIDLDETLVHSSFKVP
jgi:RNA polymerase II subunit A small phosphatase-like protein